MAIGFPAPVRDGRIAAGAREPRPRLGALRLPARVQAAGAHHQRRGDAGARQPPRGRLLFLGLGTGLGAALVLDGLTHPLEIAHLPYRDGWTYEDLLGKDALDEVGKKRWRRLVFEIVPRLKAAFQVDEVVLGRRQQQAARPRCPPAAAAATTRTPSSAASGSSRTKPARGRARKGARAERGKAPPLARCSCRSATPRTRRACPSHLGADRRERRGVPAAERPARDAPRRPALARVPRVRGGDVPRAARPRRRARDRRADERLRPVRLRARLPAGGAAAPGPLHLHVPARRLHAPVRQHAVPLDLRRQRRAAAGRVRRSSCGTSRPESPRRSRTRSCSRPRRCRSSGPRGRSRACSASTSCGSRATSCACSRSCRRS